MSDEQSRYAYVYFNDTIEKGDLTADGEQVQLNRTLREGTVELVSTREFETLTRMFPGRVKGKTISKANVANVVTYVYNELLKELDNLGIELNEDLVDKKRTLDSLMTDGKLDPTRCDGLDDLFNKVFSFQMSVRKAESNLQLSGRTK